jgi:hypothetical protein
MDFCEISLNQTDQRAQGKLQRKLHEIIKLKKVKLRGFRGRLIQIRGILRNYCY